MNKTFINKLTVFLAVIYVQSVLADDAQLEKAIQEQVDAAGDCELIAFGIPSEKFDSQEMFSSCVETRAILIAMLKKYGVGRNGEINAFEKTQAYSYLVKSDNQLVRQEAARYETAAGQKP